MIRYPSSLFSSFLKELLDLMISKDSETTIEAGFESATIGNSRVTLPLSEMKA
tara:strand:+ start:135 stop:293 length:159 start_codon:yes stop_codon:yes gene_type:complete